MDGDIRCKLGSLRFWLEDSYTDCGEQLAGAEYYCTCPALEADPDIAGIGVR